MNEAMHATLANGIMIAPCVAEGCSEDGKPIEGTLLSFEIATGETLHVIYAGPVKDLVKALAACKNGPTVKVVYKVNTDASAPAPR